MQWISHAQNREDVVLHRVFADQPTGFYVDIGANDPCDSSITRHFYELGWHGINVEPVKAVFDRLARHRPRDTNLNVGIANRAETLRFFESPKTPTWSTFCPATARVLTGQGVVFEERAMPVLTLAQLCNRYVHGPIDFMSIDVENYEWEVIKGGDWARWRPRVVVVEDSVSPTGARNHPRWEGLLLSADYRLALCDGINRFYLRAEDAALLPLLSVPANISDPFYQCPPGVGPTGLKIARRLHAWSDRFPHTSAAVKRLGHLAVLGLRGMLRPLGASRPHPVPPDSGSAR
jgi:FkbM family methyltransferase